MNICCLRAKAKDEKNQFSFFCFHRLVLGHEFILKNERFKVKRAMFAKLFGVKAPLSSNQLMFRDINLSFVTTCLL